MQTPRATRSNPASVHPPPRAGSRRAAAGLAVTVLLGVSPLAFGATDAELFRCERAAAPLGEICHLASRTDDTSDREPEAVPAPAPDRLVTSPGSLDSATTDDLLRRFLVHEITRAERDDERSPFVHDDHAPASFSRLIDDPSRANAAAFLADQMELNLRHVKAQEAIRSVVVDLRDGRADDDLLTGLAETSNEIHAHAVEPRAPDTVLHELSMDRLRQRLAGAVETSSPGPAPATASRASRSGLELRYYFSPACPHCAEVTPAIETVERRYGSALSVVGIPIQLEGETITPDALRAYRRRFDLSFPFEERPGEVARALHEDDLHGVPHLVVLVHDVPGDPVHVPLPAVRTTADLERSLLDILDATRGTEPSRPPDPPSGPRGL